MILEIVWKVFGVLYNPDSGGNPDILFSCIIPSIFATKHLGSRQNDWLVILLKMIYKNAL